MKALTLWRPWPWAIFHAGAKRKLIENRPRKPPERLVASGWPIILHAGKHFDKRGAEVIQEVLGLTGLPEEAWQEGLIGKTLINSVAQSRDEVPTEQQCWWMGPYAYLLHGPATWAFPKPIPCSGMQGWWELPPDINLLVADTLHQMHEARR